MKTHVAILACLFLFSCGGKAASPAPAPAARDLDGTWLTLASARAATGADAGELPIVVMVTDGGWGRYEKDIFGEPDLATVLKSRRRARIERGSPELASYDLKPGPSLLVLDQAGAVITRISGRRDASVLRRAIERSAQFPIPSASLSAEPAGPKHIRYVEVLLEGDSFAGAAAAAEPYLDDPPSEESAHGLYLYTYSIAEMDKSSEARKLADRYLKENPSGPDRPAVHWILLVLDLQAEKGPDAKRRLDALVGEAPQSPFARQAVLAYAMEYLMRGKRDFASADKLLSEFIESDKSWTNEYLLARSVIRRGNPATMELGIEDLEAVAQSKSIGAERAQEMLVQMSVSPGGGMLLDREIVFFQRLARDPATGSYARLKLARLYMASEDEERAKEEASTVAATGGEAGSEARLLSASMALELDFNPQSSVELFDKLISDLPDGALSWAAKFGRSRALFFTGRRDAAAAALKEVLGFLKGREVLPEAFYLLVPYGAPPGAIAGQLEEYSAKLAALTSEDNADAALGDFLVAFLAASRGDSNAIAALDDFVGRYPASSLTDDAIMEKVKLSLKTGDGQTAIENLERIVNSYKGSDQHRVASQLLGSIKQRR